LKNLDRDLDKLDDKLAKLWPEPGNGHGKEDNGTSWWKGKWLITTKQWKKIADENGIPAALEYFPSGFLSPLVIHALSRFSEQDPAIRQWYSDYLELMEYKRDPDYGKTKCFRCLLCPERDEEGGIFMGIDKVMSRSLNVDTPDEGNRIVPVSAYPCPVLNRFKCPFDRKIFSSDDIKLQKNGTFDTDVDYLFYL
jgi:hypothetical protein